MKGYKTNHDSKRIERINDFLNKGKFTIALREIQTYMEDHPADDLGILTYADCLLKMMNQKIGDSSNYQEIEDMCLKVIDKESKFMGTAYDILGRLKVEEKDTKSAEIYFKKAIALGTDKSKTFLVSILIQNRKNQEALDLIETLKETDNFPEMTLLKKALALHNLQREQEAFDTINEIDTSKFNDAQKKRYTKIKAKIYLGMNKVPEAEAMILESIKDMVDYREEHLILLRCYMKRKVFDKAYRLCRKLIDNYSDEYKEYAGCHLGKIYESMGYIEKARNVYLTMLQNASKLSDITINILYFNLGHLELCDRNYESAKEYFEKMENLRERDTTKKKLYLTITHMRLGSRKTAEKLFNSIKNSRYLEKNNVFYQRIKNVILHSHMAHVEINSYFDHQLVCYQKSLLLKHISRTHEKPDKESRFNENIDLASLVDDAELFLQGSPIIESDVTDRYLVHYPNIGYSNGIPTDYMEIVTIGGTNKVLAMYPVAHFGEEKLLTTDTKPKKMQKKSSRIDKFNARYGLKG